MTTPHTFLFTPGIWEGEGKITFSMAEDQLDFITQWTLLPQEEGKIHLNQVVQVKTFAEPMRNSFQVKEIKGDAFKIELQNQLVGKVEGRGRVTPSVIAWEFTDPSQEFEGFEIYELQQDGSYTFKAEFTSEGGFRSHIRGSIKKSQ